MPDFTVGLMTEPTEEFTIAGSTEPMLAVYLDPLCTQPVSRLTYSAAITIVGNRSTCFYVRNETSRNVTAIKIAPSGDLADRIALANDYQGQPARFAQAGEPIIWRGVLMPNETIAFWVKFVPRKIDEPNLYEATLTIDAEMATDQVWLSGLEAQNEISSDETLLSEPEPNFDLGI